MAEEVKKQQGKPALEAFQEKIKKFAEEIYKKVKNIWQKK